MPVRRWVSRTAHASRLRANGTRISPVGRGAETATAWTTRDRILPETAPKGCTRGFAKYVARRPARSSLDASSIPAASPPRQPSIDPTFSRAPPTFRLNNAVTTFSRGAEALKTLRDRKEDFDIVLSDVHMPDMDGFKLLEHIALELDIPVMSESSQPSLHPPTTPLKMCFLSIMDERVCSWCWRVPGAFTPQNASRSRAKHHVGPKRRRGAPPRRRTVPRTHRRTRPHGSKISPNYLDLLFVKKTN